MHARPPQAFGFIGGTHISHCANEAGLRTEVLLEDPPQQSLLPFAETHLAGSVTGRYDLWLYSENVPVGIRDLSITQNFSISTQISHALSLECILSGGSDLELSGQSIHSNNIPRAYLSSYSANGRQTRLYKQGDKIRGVGIWLPPQLLIEEFGLDVCKLTGTTRSLIELQTQTTVTLALSANLSKVLKEILDMPYQNQLADKFLHAKITELLCYATELITSPDTVYRDDNLLSRHKSSALNEIIQTLNNNLAFPPSLEALAHQVGVSRSTLTAMFKSSYGVSVSQYLLQKRMVAALDLLRMGKQSIAEIALSVGYENQSAFGRAYKKFYGHTPKNDHASG